MKKIQELVDQIDEEIDGAKNYAETYLDYKAKGNGTWSSKYKTMSEDELRHATTLHERAVGEIEELSKVYTPPVDMQKAWDESHKMYVEKVAWIKQMLAM